MLAAPLGLAWVELCRHADAVAAKRRACDHEWGPVIHVTDHWGRAWGYVQKCACGEQKHVNIDGTDYVPEYKRPRRG